MIVDIHTRECLAIEAGQSLRGEDVVRVLNWLKQGVEFLCDMEGYSASPITILTQHPQSKMPRHPIPAWRRRG